MSLGEIIATTQGKESITWVHLNETSRAVRFTGTRSRMVTEEIGQGKVFKRHRESELKKKSSVDGVNNALDALIAV